MQIAIDGPASSGKSTIAKRVAKHYDYTYCDTGAMYRTVTYLAQKNDVEYSNEDKIVELMKEHSISFKNIDGEQHVYLDDEDVSKVIRTPEIAENVSEVSSHKGVRIILVDKQREIAETSSVVMDGRDIGTTVLPDADVKIFMIASVHERALRRYRELKEKGLDVKLETIENDLAERDHKDTHRKISPLKKANDAIEIDTTKMSIEEVVDEIIAIVNKKA